MKKAKGEIYTDFRVTCPHCNEKQYSQYGLEKQLTENQVFDFADAEGEVLTCTDCGKEFEISGITYL